MADKKQDIAPELLNRILTSFETKLRGNEKLAALTDKLQNGTAAYADAYEYALEVGTALSDTFAEELSSDVLPDGKMYFNIANRVVRDPLTRAYGLIADECEGVQTQLNTAAGIALKAQRPSFPENRIKGFIDRISSEPDYNKVSWILREPVKTYSQSVVDESIRKNAEFHYKAGLSPEIIRSAAAGCCEWCTAVEGKYPYPNVPKDIYRRHNFCRCQVEYDPKTGKRQDVHTRRWSDQEGYVRYRDIEDGKASKAYGNASERIEQSKDITEKERLKARYLNTVSTSALDAEGFKDKFKGITGNEDVDNAIYESAVEILNHRSGTRFEDIYFIDADTGASIHKLTTVNKIDQVTYDDETKEKIAEAHSKNQRIIAIHNHPGGLPPSLDDGVSAFNHDYVKGIAVGHNLEVWSYSKTNANYEDDCDKFGKAVVRMFGFDIDFDENEWYDLLKPFGMEVERR